MPPFDPLGEGATIRDRPPSQLTNTRLELGPMGDEDTEIAPSTDVMFQRFRGAVPVERLNSQTAPTPLSSLEAFPLRGSPETYHSLTRELDRASKAHEPQLPQLVLGIVLGAALTALVILFLQL